MLRNKGTELNKFIFIVTFKMRKRKQRKAIQSPSQPHV